MKALPPDPFYEQMMEGRAWCAWQERVPFYYANGIMVRKLDFKLEVPKRVLVTPYWRFRRA
jgi:hypothetical protein